MWHLNYDTTKLTVELRELVENGVKVWDFEYPSYYKGDEKTAFEQKVLDHYWFRQIGQETPGRFLHYFRSRIREIMPYYIQMYKSVELMEAQEDPFQSYNLTETYSEERTGSGSVTGSTSASSTSESETGSTHQETKTGENDLTRKFSNTPQGSISNLDKYMTEATTEHGSESESVNGGTTSHAEATATNTGTSETTSEDSGSVTHTLTRKGNIGVQPLGKEVQALRESFINIDMMIIGELKDLFLQVY